LRWPSVADAGAVDDRQAVRKVNKSAIGQQPTEGPLKGSPTLILQTENDDSCMGPGWVLADIGKVKVERQQNATLIGGGLENRWIALAAMPFANNRLDVVSVIAQ
jgi:hypothetical protein